MRLTRFLLITVLAFVAVACSKVNMENYSRLKVGQSYDEVVAVLGQPARCDEILGVRQCLWGDEARNVKAGFVGGMALTLTAHNLK
jgi:hypothetical protein